MQHGFCSKRYHQCQRRLVLLRLTQLIALLGVTWQILIPLCALHWSFDDAQYVVGCAQVYHWVGISARSSGCRSHSKHASASHSLVAFPCSASGESSPVDATRCLTSFRFSGERRMEASMMAWSMPSGFFAARSRDLSRLAAVLRWLRTYIFGLVHYSVRCGAKRKPLVFTLLLLGCLSQDLPTHLQVGSRPPHCCLGW